MFRVLGPLEVSINEQPVSVGRNRQLTVLALLLMDVNKTVSVGRLVEAVWNGCPPKTAAEQIQTCIWRLRRSFVLAGAQSGLIETTASGYTLRLDEGSVDTCVFEQEVRDAKAAAARGENEAAVAQFRKALKLFRGPVLAEVTSPLVQAVAAKWEERRLTVLEECIERELVCGRDRELVDELTALVEQHPLRERLRGQLMLALHSGDRRAEALAAYREGRSAMISRLGLEPGPKLQELHRTILTGELASPTAAAAPLEVQAPAQLLADAPDFVERPEHTTEILRLLSGDSNAVARGRARVVAVLGKCGAGKSSLAVHVAHQVRDEFPDGQLYADLGGSRCTPADIGEVLCGFLRALGVPDARIPVELPERAAMYRSILAQRRVLVVLDDAVDAAQAQRLLPGGPDNAVLITSRTSLTDLPGVHAVEVDVLSDSEAVELLARVVGDERVRAEPDAVREIVHAAGHLPLSIRAAGARLAARPHLALAHLAGRLRDPQRRLDELAHGALDLRESLEPSLRGLTDEAKDLWYALSLVQVPDFASWVAAVVADIPLLSAEKLLDCLVDRRLVDIVGVDPMGTVRHRLHHLIGLYARERAYEQLSESSRSRMLDRLADCWIGLAERAQFAISGEQRRSSGPKCLAAADKSVVDMVEADPDQWLRVEHDGLKFATQHQRSRPVTRFPMLRKADRPRPNTDGGWPDCGDDTTGAVPARQRGNQPMQWLLSH